MKRQTLKTSSFVFSCSGDLITLKRIGLILIIYQDLPLRHSAGITPDFRFSLGQIVNFFSVRSS